MDCTSATLPATNAIGQDLGVPSLPNLPDKDLTYDVRYLSGQLSPRASIMACVAAMHELALLDMNTSIGQRRRWTHPNYPGVIVSMEEHQGSRSTARFAMWLIQAAIRDMMLRQTYQPSELRGQYRKVPIGRVYFSQSSQHTVPLEQAQTTAPAASKQSINGVSFNLQLPKGPGRTASNDAYNARVQYLDKPMDMRDAFFSVIWLLMTFGGYGHEPLRVSHIVVLSITVEVKSVWNTVRRSPGGAYSLTAADMVNMVASLAVVLEREPNLREMNVLVSEGEVLLARGAIRTGPLPREMASALMANVTMS
ncbi:MAG: hypothetical protein Q9169_002377 [Polycauliona sp. 2 TL-2023]